MSGGDRPEDQPERSTDQNSPDFGDVMEYLTVGYDSNIKQPSPVGNDFPAAEDLLAFAGDTGPGVRGRPVVGDQQPTPPPGADTPPPSPPRPGDAPTPPPPTDSPPGRIDLPTITDEQRQQYLRDNPQIAADVRAMAEYFTPQIVNNEYENTINFRDLSSGHGSSRMKEMLRRATIAGPEEVAKFMAAVNHELNANPLTRGMRLEAAFTDNNGRTSCEFTLKRPEAPGVRPARPDDKWTAEAPVTQPRAPRGPARGPR